MVLPKTVHTSIYCLWYYSTVVSRKHLTIAILRTLHPNITNYKQVRTEKLKNKEKMGRKQRCLKYCSHRNNLTFNKERSLSKCTRFPSVDSSNGMRCCSVLQYLHLHITFQFLIKPCTTNIRNAFTNLTKSQI